MAKYGVTNVAGGGGIGSDEISVTKEYVLNGKTYVGSDTNDEIGTGTMANNGATVNQSLNAGGFFSVKKGYHTQDFTVNANSLASQTSATATSAHILNGQSAWVNGNKINGGIPIQSGDAAQDQVWNTNWSTWGDGNIFMGVRSGHYLNGVNWIRANIPNFVAGNIKKGVNIGGVIGTWEGYVPGATDLYYRGNNIYGWVANNYYNYIKFDSGQITFTTGRNEEPAILSKSFSTVGYSRLNVECYVSEPTTSLVTRVRLWCNGTQMGNISTTDNPVGSVVRSFDIVGYQLDAQFVIYFYNMGKMAVYRIWLS